MVNYNQLGLVVEARQNFTDEELIRKNIDNLMGAHVNTVLPIDDIHLTVAEMYRMAEKVEVNEKNVQQMCRLITVKQL